jgi:hypothetical protein
VQRALKLDWRLSHEKPSEDCDEAELDPKHTESVKCKIFLGFTSNLVSSGIRDVIRFLVQHHMVNTPSLHHFCVQSANLKTYEVHIYILLIKNLLVQVRQIY